jgi:hypothetical protein
MKKIYFAVAFGMLATAMLTSSCVKDDFADPVPSSDTTSITRNTTIDKLKGMYGFPFKAVPDSVIIEGVVISSDKAGNFYKSIYIQDEKGGIEIKLGKTTIYNDYKLGQRVVVVCKGLFIGDYGGMKQLGSTYSPGGITQIGGLETDYIISQHIFKKGKMLVPPTPEPITVLSDAVVGKLVKIEKVQFLSYQLDGSALTYADSKAQLTRNRDIVKVGSKTTPWLALRTSGYAAFAGDPIPSGSGSIVGVLSVFNGDYQLFIRDTKDVMLVDPRY